LAGGLLSLGSPRYVVCRAAAGGPSIALLARLAAQLFDHDVLSNCAASSEFESEAEERRFWDRHHSTEGVASSMAGRVRLPNLRLSTTSISLRGR
jgi:hypothetical protein